MPCKLFWSSEVTPDVRWHLSAQEQMIDGTDLVEKFANAQRAGFDGIELRGAGGGAFAARLPELRAARDAGVVLPSVCVMMDHFIGDFDPDRRRSARAGMKDLLSVIAEVGGTGAVTPASFGMFSKRLPPFAPPRVSGTSRPGSATSSSGTATVWSPGPGTSTGRPSSPCSRRSATTGGWPWSAA
jgi:hypothetical protein